MSSKRKHSISFERLKTKIKKNLYTRDLMFLHGGEYLIDRMLQSLGKQETISRNFAKTDTDLRAKFGSVIDAFDVRCLNELIEFCKSAHIDIPSWLSKKTTIELWEDGWHVVEL